MPLHRIAVTIACFCMAVQKRSLSVIVPCLFIAVQLQGLPSLAFHCSADTDTCSYCPMLLLYSAVTVTCSSLSHAFALQYSYCILLLYCSRPNVIAADICIVVQLLLLDFYIVVHSLLVWVSSGEREGGGDAR